MNKYIDTNSIKTFLDFYETQYIGAPRKGHLLFLEGTSDRSFYREVFRERKVFGVTPFFDNFDNQCILPYSKTFNDMMDEPVEDKDKSNVQFVIAATEAFEKNRSNYECIDVFGFIDRDYDYDISSINCIRKTTEHDLETNLLFLYLPSYIKSISNSDIKRNIVNLISRVLIFTVKQGVLGKVSWDYSYQEGVVDAEKVHFICHTYFKKNKEARLYHSSYFNFEQYLLDDVFSISRSFMNYYSGRSEELVFTDLENDVPAYINAWLLGDEELDKKAKSQLKKYFRLTNGHIFLRQLILTNPGLFGLYISDRDRLRYDQKELDDCETALFKKMVVEYKKDEKPLFTINPLVDYCGYRKKDY